jgi:hypothetical protein
MPLLALVTALSAPLHHTDVALSAGC